MERIIGVNPVTEALLNKEKNIEKLELYNGLKGETVQKLKELASKRNIKIFYTIVLKIVKLEINDSKRFHY